MHQSPWRAFACALVFCHIARAAAASGPPADPVIPERVTLGVAVSLFRAHGLDLLLAEAAVAGAEGDLAASRQVANPNLQASIGRVTHYDPTVDGCDGCSRTALGASISDSGALLDAVTGKRSLRVGVARAALEAARSSREDADRTLVALVKGQWVQVAAAQEALAFASETAVSTAETFRLVDLRYRLGALSEADSARAETAQLEADQAVSAARQALDTARAQLAFLLGARKPAAPFEVDAASLKALAGEGERALLDRALERRPDLAAARKQEEGARAALALARRQRIPDAALSVLYAQTGNGQSALQPPTLTAGLSFDLPLFHNHGGEIARAEANLRSAEIARAKVEAQVAADVRTSLVTVEATRERLARAEGRLLDRARRGRDLVKLQYEKGAASLLELLDAERSWIAANAEYRQNLADRAVALFQLEQAAAEEIVR